jgi:hypothetical protein
LSGRLGIDHLDLGCEPADRVSAAAPGKESSAMQTDFSAEAVAAAVRRYLADEISAEAMREYLSECDAAIRAGAADRGLSRPVGAAALVLMEQAEGVRPPADVRSTLQAVERSLMGVTSQAPRRARAPIPRPKPLKGKQSHSRRRSQREP